MNGLEDTGIAGIVGNADLQPLRAAFHAGRNLYI